MPARLAVASTLTLGLLVGGLLTVLFTAMVLAGAPSPVLWLMMGLGVLLNAAVWAFGPWLMDLVQRWFYKVEQLPFHEFERRHPGVGQFMRQVCEREGIPLPQMRLLRDDNPTAYTYGSLPSNARVALTDGLFRFLDEDEVCAVAAHELGHIRHYDFAVMTIASTLLQLLYESYWYLSYRGDDRDSRLRAVGIGAYILWWAGTYAVLWLSRSREYMADRFAAQHMGTGQQLQTALVKIAYGLAELQASGQAAQGGRLLQSTRALGIADPSASASMGKAFRAIPGGGQARVEGSLAVAADPVTVTGGRGPSFDPEAIEPVFLFDLFSPWATVSELGSTHPLTGKRIRELDEVSKELGRPPLFRWKQVTAQGEQLDKVQLYGDFSFEVFIWFLPYLLPLLALILAFAQPQSGLAFVTVAFGLGLVLRAAYSYAFLGSFEPATVYELMCDPYASPLRGRPVILEGEVIGKGDAGSRVSEDLEMKDRSGGLILLNYQGLFPLIGNLLFGMRGAERSIGKPITARGWFRRGVAQYVDLYDAEVQGVGRISSYTRLWAVQGGVVVMLLGLVWLYASWPGVTF